MTAAADRRSAGARLRWPKLSPVLCTAVLAVMAGSRPLSRSCCWSIPASWWMTGGKQHLGLRTVVHRLESGRHCRFRHQHLPPGGRDGVHRLSSGGADGLAGGAHRHAGQEADRRLLLDRLLPAGAAGADGLDPAVRSAIRARQPGGKAAVRPQRGPVQYLHLLRHHLRASRLALDRGEIHLHRAGLPQSRCQHRGGLAYRRREPALYRVAHRRAGADAGVADYALHLADPFAGILRDRADPRAVASASMCSRPRSIS